MFTKSDRCNKELRCHAGRNFEQNYGASSMSVRQRDVAAAVKGAVAAGVEVARVEVDKEGRIVIVAGKPSESATEVSTFDDGW